MAQTKTILRALAGETLPTPPIWMMRQAGRYLPEYREIRAEAGSFMSLCTNPELACEVTLQPLRRYAMDAAILFSDILVVPRAMGIHVELKDNLGPIIPNPIRTMDQVNQVIVPDVHETLGYVFDAIKLTKQMLNDRTRARQ